MNLTGLINKTISVRDSANYDATWYVVSYYRPVDILHGRLSTPSMDEHVVR